MQFDPLKLAQALLQLSRHYTQAGMDAISKPLSIWFYCTLAAYAFRLGCSRLLRRFSEDMVQDVWRLLLKRLRDKGSAAWNDEGHVLGFICLTCRGIVLKYRDDDDKCSYLDEGVDVADPHADAHAMVRCTLDEIWRAIDAQYGPTDPDDPPWPDIYWLNKLGWSCRALAQKFGIPSSTINDKIHEIDDFIRGRFGDGA